MVALVGYSADWVIDYKDMRRRKTKEAYLIIIEPRKEFVNTKINVWMTGEISRSVSGKNICVVDF